MASDCGAGMSTSSPGCDAPGHADTAGNTLTLPVLCPLCLSAPVRDPVCLHEGGSSRSACVACRACAQRWGPLFHAAQKNQRGAVGEVVAAECPACSTGMTIKMDVDTGLPHFRSIADAQTLPRALGNAVVSAGTPGSEKDGRFDLAKHVASWREAVAVAGAATQSTSAVGSVGGGQPNTLCGVCEEAPSTRMCRQCDFGLCDACQASTHTKGRFKLHEVVSLEEAERLQSGDRAQASADGARQPHRKCALHTQQSLDLYCRTCRECICVACCFGGDHKGDDVVPLADIATESRASMTEVAEAMQATVDEAVRTSSALRSAGPAYSELVAGVEGQIHSTFAKLRKVLEDREAALVMELKGAAEGMSAGVAAQTHLSDSIRDALTHSRQQFSQFLHQTDNVTLMNTLPGVVSAQQRLQAFASGLSVDARFAQESLQARLSCASSRTAADAPVALFQLFPEDHGNGSGSSAAVEEYASLLSSLGQLKAQQAFPGPDDVPPPVETDEVGEDRAEERRSLSCEMGNAANDDHYRLQRGAEGTRREECPRPAAPKRPREQQQQQQQEPRARTATSETVDEEPLVMGPSPFYVESRGVSSSTATAARSAPANPPPATAAAVKKPSFVAVGTSVVEATVSPLENSLDSRRTEAHHYLAPRRDDDDWPMFGAAGTAAAVQQQQQQQPSTQPLRCIAEEMAGGSVGRKRLLDIGFGDSVFERSSIAAVEDRRNRVSEDHDSMGGSAPSEAQRLERFSNSSSNAGALGLAPRQTFEWEPVTKMNRLETSVLQTPRYDSGNNLRLDDGSTLGRPAQQPAPPATAEDNASGKSGDASSFNLQLII